MPRGGGMNLSPTAYFYAPALGSNNAAARYAKYSAKHTHPCARFSLCLHIG